MMKPTKEQIAHRLWGAIGEKLARGMSIADIVDEIRGFDPDLIGACQAMERNRRDLRNGRYRLPRGLSPVLVDDMIAELRRRTLN